MRLGGLVAIVTGAGRGIGASIASGLAREGAAVVVNYPQEANEAEQVAAAITTAGGRAIAVQGDVRLSPDHERLVAIAQQEFGGLDVLVNNAGIEYRESFLDTTTSQFDETLNVNLRGVYFLSQAAARAMVARGQPGRIINIASCHDTVPLALRSAYAVSKGGLAMLTKSMALELAEHGINVNGIAPGAILTEMNRAALSPPETMNRLLGTIPLNRIGTPEDLVGAVVFLSSSEASYITGTTIYVDGGLLLRKM